MWREPNLRERGLRGDIGGAVKGVIEWGGGPLLQWREGHNFPKFGQFITCYTYNVISQLKPGTYSS